MSSASGAQTHIHTHAQLNWLLLTIDGDTLSGAGFNVSLDRTSIMSLSKGREPRALPWWLPLRVLSAVLLLVLGLSRMLLLAALSVMLLLVLLVLLVRVKGPVFRVLVVGEKAPVGVKEGGLEVKSEWVSGSA